MPAFFSNFLASKSPYTIPHRMRKSFFILSCLFVLALLTNAGNVQADEQKASLAELQKKLNWEMLRRRIF